MTQLLSISSRGVPALVTAAGERARIRFLEFFGANIRNPHTRRAYYRAADERDACSSFRVGRRGISQLEGLDPPR